MTSTAVSDRIEREKSFHDHRFGTEKVRQTDKFYRATETATAAYDHLVRTVDSSRALEYGCGRGSSAFDLAAAGTDVIGIDISDVAIEMATDEAEARGVEATFLAMNAEALDFEDASFDLVIGSGILHHLDLELAVAEITRVLEPGGRAVFLEPMGYNPLINLYRRMTPEIRTPDEHPLLRRDLDLFDRSFSTTDVSFHGLSTLGAAPLLDLPGGPTMLRAAQAIDARLLAVPYVQLLGWIVVLDFTR